MSAKLDKDFICLKCKSSTDFSAQPVESSGDGIEAMRSFLYFGSKVDTSGDCETTVTERMRSGRAKFKECRDILLSKSFLLKIKGRVYASCVRSAMLFGSEVWCLRQNELDILKRTETTMVRAICGVKLSDRFKSKSLIDRLGFKKTSESLAKASGVRWFCHVMRRDEGNVLRKVLTFKIDGLKKRVGRKKSVKKNSFRN